MQLKSKSEHTKSQQEQVVKDKTRQGSNHVHVKPDATHTRNWKQYLNYFQKTDQNRPKRIHTITKLVGKKNSGIKT